MSMVKILIADDEIKYRITIGNFLKKEGYEVISAKDGEEAIDIFFSNEGINLVILDVLMPKFDGWSVCKEIRKKSEVPILMLTALSDSQNEVNGLSLGADDYISKPFRYEIFIARVKALLRRVVNEEEKNLQVGDVIIDQCNHVVAIGGKQIEVTQKEYQLIKYFAKNIGRILTRDQILNAVWGYDYFGDSRTIDTHIKTLRAKLGDQGKLIETVRGYGYRMRESL